MCEYTETQILKARSSRGQTAEGRKEGDPETARPARMKKEKNVGREEMKVLMRSRMG